jgi:hypothetical protein
VHHQDGNVMCGVIVEKLCNVKFYRFIPHNLEDYPFVALVCVGIHNHPPPPPERTPNDVKDSLQTMIKETIEKDDVVTSGSIIQGIII